MPLFEDNLSPYLTLVEQGSTPASPAAGNQKAYIRTSDHTLVTVNSSGTVTGIGGGSDPTYSAYTPTLTGSGSNPTLGSGSSAAGRYTQHGKLVHFYAKIQFGSSGVAVGSGYYVVSLPVAPRNPPPDIFGSFGLYDDSAGLFYTGSVYTNGNATSCRMIYANSTNLVGSTTPWTWAANDLIMIEGMYEAA